MHVIRKYFTLQKFLFIFCITLISSFCLFTAVNFITAYAEEGIDANGDSISHLGELNKHNGEGYPSSSKTGWIIYLYDYKSGERPYGASLVLTGKLAGDNKVTSVFGDTPSGYSEINMPRPFIEGGAAQGLKVKNGLVTKGSSYYWERLVKKCFGESALQKVKEEPDKYYLVLEVVTSHALTPGSGGGKNVYTATVHNWAKLHKHEGKTDGAIGWCDNAVAPDSASLDKDWEGLPKVPKVHSTDKQSASGRLPDSLVGDKNLGYGMIAIRIKDDSIHTYFKEHGSPGQEEKAQPNKIGKYNMVKVYYTKYMKNGVLKEEKQDGHPYVEPNCVPTISVDDEPNEYHLEHWSSNTDFNPSVDYKTVRSMHGPQSGDGAKIVKLSLEERKEKTVYVVLVRIKDEKEEKDYNYLMTQSMITRTIWFNYPDNKKGMTMMSDDSFTWSSPAHPDKCEGHSHTHKTGSHLDSEGHRVDDYTTFSGACTEPKWKEHQIKFSLYNDLKDGSPDIVANREDLKGVEVQDKKGGTETKRWEPLGTPEKTWGWDVRKDDEMTTESKYNTAEKYRWDYICVIMRGDDKLTVAKTANEGGWIVDPTSANEDLKDASSSGFVVDDTKQGTRKTDDYYEHFDNNFDEDPEGDYETTVIYSKRWVCPTCGHKFGICNDTEEYSLDSPMSTHVIVKVETYSGNPNGGFENNELDTTEKIVKKEGLPSWADSSVNTHSGRMVNAENKISFLPYVLMKYQTRSSGIQGWNNTLKNKFDGWLRAYVLGQYMRSINPNDYAEIHWDKKNDPNMTLFSNQWSTHALAADCWGVNNVLPGGATLGIKIPKRDRQTVYATTLQCYTEGYGKDQCEKTGGDPGSVTKDECIGNHEAFVKEVAGSLDNTNVQQWQSDGVEDDFAWDNGKKVNRGETLSGINTSGKRSSDDLKYYFGDITSGSNKGDYDTHIEETVTHTYTFYSDVNGDIHMTIDNTSPKQYDDDGAYSPIADAINERTMVRDKLIDAVEQAKEGDDERHNEKKCSDDKALNDEKWYNEEFDGITVIVQETPITTGFIDPAERSEVLDPKLTQTQKSKGKQFGMEFKDKDQQKGTYELGQFKTRNYSENWGEDHPEILASFKGSTVAMDKLEYFYWTRKFWIPNLTVQDIY